MFLLQLKKKKKETGRKEGGGGEGEGGGGEGGRGGEVVDPVVLLTTLVRVPERFLSIC